MKHHHTTRRGISLAETVVSTLLIGFILVSTLQIVGPIARSSALHADRIIAANLANELTEEISTKLFIDPSPASPDDLGFDANDSKGSRADFDDIDDYNGWSISPPMLSQGYSLSNLTGWTRSAKVVHVETADPTKESATYTGLKRVTVTVQKNGTTLATIVTYHSQAADAIGFIVPVQPALDSNGNPK